MNGHIEEQADLYALGMLDARERSEVERHAASCEQCAARIERARDDIALIEGTRTQIRPPSSLAARLRDSTRGVGVVQHRVTIALAFAAALAISLLPTWVAVDRNRTLRTAMSSDEQALARMASAPAMRRATFMAGKAPMGKVLYGPHGDWYYVIIMKPKPNMQIAYLHSGAREMLGTLAMHGASGTLYLPVNHRMDELALMDGGRIVADAHLVY